MSRRRVRLLVVGALLAATCALIFDATDALRRIELESVDTRFSARGTQDPSGDVVVVGIDDKSIDELDNWPFKRGLHAQAIERLAKDGAKVIAYDVEFTTESPFPRHDQLLVDAVYEHSKLMVLATTAVGEDGATKVLGNGSLVEVAGGRVGNAIMPADANAVRRRVPYSYQGLESFAVAAVEQGTGRPVDSLRFGTTGAWIDFHGPGGTLPYVSFVDLLEERFPAGFFKDKYVIVGAAAPPLQDVAATSTSGDGTMYGPEIQAEAVSTILRDFPLRSSPGWLTVVLIGLMSVLPGLASTRLSTSRTFFASTAAALLFCGAALLAFLTGLVIPVVVPLSALAIATVAALAVAAILEAFERQRVRDAFSHFVPEAVVDVVLDQMGGELRLGGSSRECTLLFSDLRGFTTYSESRPADQVIDILNAYLSEMTDAIMENGGTLMSFLGDGIMALFGAPLDQPDHRDRALNTAREMLARLDAFNERGGDQFRMGIGINTGLVTVGNVGSTRRLQYTAIGDAVNTASRIEGLTKGTPYQVFIAETTFDGLEHVPQDLVYVDEMAIRGRQSGVRLWALAPAAAVGPQAGTQPVDTTAPD